MEKEPDIETKYQKLASEYSKVRSQAAVLKKAVVDEQTKNVDLHEVIKNHEQTIRKREQEIESLTFRNDQLTKRITVLQQELQEGDNTKKGKSKPLEIPKNVDISVLNEELQKKILENAQLYNTIAGKDMEIIDYNGKIKDLEEMVSKLHKELEEKEKYYSENHKKTLDEISSLKATITSINNKPKLQSSEEFENVKHWEAEAERWRTECELLTLKPDSYDKLTNYYESKLREILDKNVMLRSEMKTAYAENLILKARLENITTEYNDLKNKMESSYEELIVANDNYKSQLDAMTEHLAAQNEKITRQCDEIQILKYKLGAKK